MTVTDSTAGALGNPEYVIQWDGRPYFTEGSAIMQLILNDIEMQYQIVD